MSKATFPDFSHKSTLTIVLCGVLDWDSRSFSLPIMGGIRARPLDHSSSPSLASVQKPIDASDYYLDTIQNFKHVPVLLGILETFSTRPFSSRRRGQIPRKMPFPFWILISSISVPALTLFPVSKSCLLLKHTVYAPSQWCSNRYSQYRWWHYTPFALFFGKFCIVIPARKCAGSSDMHVTQSQKQAS